VCCLPSSRVSQIADNIRLQDVAEQVMQMTQKLNEGFADTTEISPTMGPPLMLVFCVATNFLLLTILICLLSKSYDKV
jgi:hypothetical protein